jgi:gamma-glutamyltranspeptidase/glutathione hydrolase
VSASHPLGARAGAAILQHGGNAIDAAAAVQFALNVVEPQSSGLGGGSVLMLYLARGERTLILDGRETAPAASTSNQFLARDGNPAPFDEAHLQGTAVGVPGTLRCLAVALERFGTLPLSDTLAPAITLAEEGFPVNRVLAADLATGAEKLATWPSSAAVFLPNGRPMREGDRLRQPDLARTLRLVRDRGPSVFYEGEVGRALVAAQAQRGGRMTMADLAAYRVRERKPLMGGYRGFRIAAAPPPFAGPTLLHLLQLLEPLGLYASGRGTGPTLHLLLEAMRLAYADRTAYLADSDFAPVPVRGLLDPGYLADRRALIDPTHAGPNPSRGDPCLYEPAARAGYSHFQDGEEGPNTTHFVVVDTEGNIVTCSATIEWVWGTGMIVPEYGFLLNNELTDFDFTPGGPNQIAPAKRPGSSMVPTIVFRGNRPHLALGSPGGARIVASVLQVILNLIEHRMGLQEAIDAARVFSNAYPDFSWEAGIPAETLAALRALGHVPAEGPTRLGAVQAALRGPSDNWIGGADPRREGTVIYVER